MTFDPITPKRPDLEEGRKEERDQPANDQCKHDLDRKRHCVGLEYSCVEEQYRKLDERNSDDIPELEHEQDLRYLSFSVVMSIEFILSVPSEMFLLAPHSCSRKAFQNHQLKHR